MTRRLTLIWPVLLFAACASSGTGRRSGIIIAIQQYDADILRIWSQLSLANAPPRFPDPASLNEQQLQGTLESRRAARSGIAKTLADIVEGRQANDRLALAGTWRRLVQGARDAASVESAGNEMHSLTRVAYRDIERVALTVPEVPLLEAAYAHSVASPADVREALWRALEDKRLELRVLRAVIAADDKAMQWQQIEASVGLASTDPAIVAAWERVRSSLQRDLETFRKASREAFEGKSRWMVQSN